MARQRSHSIEFKRQVAQEFIAGESLYALSKRHDISRQLVRVWVQKYEAGALDEDAQAADLLQEYEAKIAAARCCCTQGRHRTRFIDEVYNTRRLHSALARLSEPRAIRGSTRPATCQNRRLKLSTIKGALHTCICARLSCHGPCHRLLSQEGLRSQSVWATGSRFP